MERPAILDAVRRTAAANGGSPLGRLRLETEAGVKEHHWRKYWARYSDLIKEAGLTPNVPQEPWTQDQLCEFVALLARELERFPTHADIRVKKTSDPTFPNHRVLDRRLGLRAQKIAKVGAWCRDHEGFADVLTLCETAAPVEDEDATPTADKSRDGHVYLIKSGRYFKVGFSVHAGARERQIALQLPDPVVTVHVIATDDPRGIEEYWHRRFSEKRKNGEWFELTKADVAAFKRRKFM